MFRKFDSNKRKMGESSSGPLKASQTGPQTEVVVDDPSLVTPSPTAIHEHLLFLYEHVPSFFICCSSFAHFCCMSI